MKYSNPRLQAVIPDWPHGARRCTATFNIETHPTRGQRATRTTTIDGRASKPKLGVYAPAVRIVDGEDGRTYIASLTIYGHIGVMRGDMQFSAGVLFEEDTDYAAARALFDEVK